MAQDAHLSDIDLEHDAARRDRLRSAVPTLVSLALLLGVTLVGALALRQLAGLGLLLVMPQ